MKISILGMGLILSLSGAALAQNASSTGSGSIKNNTSATKTGSGLSIASGTQVAAELQSTLNAEKAKAGDEVILKTTSVIRQNGQVVIQKGSKSSGRVTDVQRKAKGEAGSRISVLVDTLKQGDVLTPISASIVSVTSVASRVSASNDSLFADSNVSSSSSASASRGSAGGGLLGGVGNTAGGVANTATSTVGGVAGTATNTVGGLANTAGSTVGSAGSAIRGISVSQSADASASGGSTISLGSGNLKLEKGTTFRLSVSESSNTSVTKGN